MLFSMHGPADVSLRTIAREADVNHGIVHEGIREKVHLLIER